MRFRRDDHDDAGAVAQPGARADEETQVVHGDPDQVRGTSEPWEARALREGKAPRETPLREGTAAPEPTPLRGPTAPGGDEPELERRRPAARPESYAEVQAARHEEFGGIFWGAAFFGWLSAIGLAAILAGLLAGAGAALGIAESESVETIGVGGAIALLVVLAISYFSGGYVAGRMSRFDGARQGLAVWIWSIIAVGVLGLLAAIAGSEYNVLERFDLPRIPIDEGTLTTGGVIALVLGVVIPLVAAIAGGKAGERFHHKVDRVGILKPPKQPG